MEILIYKNTTDADLAVGTQVCYANTFGVHCLIEHIAKIHVADGMLLYTLHNTFAAYLASELKLIKS